MKRLIYILIFVLIGLSSNAQYYTQAGLAGVEAARSAFEGDMYLDTTNNDYRIGLTHGRLGYLNDKQLLDSIKIEGDTMRVYIQNGNSTSFDISGLNGEGANVGDIKEGAQSTDHNGWYILDGRSVATLPANAQTNATTLGIGASLPDASNLTMKMTNGVESLMSTGGAATITLAQANIPAYSLPSSSTNSSGSHTHTATIDSAGKHDHTVQGQNITKALKNFSSSGSNTDSAMIEGGITPLNTDIGGKHIHTATVSSSGAHTHTVSVNSGGSGTSINNYQPYFVIRRFIYLGL